MNVAFFTALFLVFLRLLSFFIVVPIFFPKGTPNTVKIGLSLILSYTLLPGLAPDVQATAFTAMGPFVIACMCEVITGLTLGYIVTLCFNFIRFSGNLMDMQVGFAMMTMFDPTASGNTTFLEKILYNFSLVIFFIVDGHHMLIHEIINSFDAVKLGKFILGQDAVMMILKAFTEFFAIGVKIAIPIMIIILISDLTLGLVARTVPQLNVMILGMPIKILVGLACFSLALPIFLSMIEKSFMMLPDVYKGFYKTLPVLLVFASDDKTEEATPRKKGEARKKGQVAKSKEVGLALTLLASTIVIATLGNYFIGGMKDTMVTFLSSYLNTAIDYDSVTKISVVVAWRVAVIVLPMIVPIMVMGVFASFIQTGVMFTKEPLKPDLKKLNPINGFKRIFSARTMVELLKDLLIITVVGKIGFDFIRDNYMNILNLTSFTPAGVIQVIGSLTTSIFMKITLIMVSIALIDYVFQRRQHNKDMRMTKQEIKDEFKQDEGDPQVKGKRRQIARQLAMGRMMAEVPKATVVVTNPTHFAVAIKYEEGMTAPKVVAKGADYIAFKIKEKAKESNVPMMENKPLARMIYDKVEINDEIPMDMYEAVAELLAIVYKLKKK